MLRITTSSTLKNFRLNLTSSYGNLVDASTTVLTQRNFNSYAEDPASASEAFTLRRSFLRASAQERVCSSVMSQHDAAWSALESVINEVNAEKGTSAWATVMATLNSTNDVARNSLGSHMEQLAQNLTQAMNVKYGDTYIYSGADGADVPFSWENGELLYQGIPVDTPDCSAYTLSDAGDAVLDADGNPVEGVTVEDFENWQKLKELAAETRYVDIGLGLQEDGDDNLIKSSAFNTAMPGIAYLGYGLDEDGMPNNIISIIGRMSELLSACDSNGAWHEDDAQAALIADEYRALAQKFDESAADVSTAHVNMDTQAEFLQNNYKQLTNTAYTLNEQIMDIEKVDMAQAITTFSWAQYSYNAALKVGNSILSETLIDYMR